MRVKSLLEIPSLMLRNVFLSAICFLITTGFTAHAGGVRGFVKDEKGEPLAYTTIFVKQTGSGTTTNVNGEYEIVTGRRSL